MAVGQVAHLVLGDSRLAASVIAVLLPTLFFLLVQFSYRFLPRVSIKTKPCTEGEPPKDGCTSKKFLPRVSSKLPIFGHIIQLQRYSAEYIRGLISKTPAPLFTINLLGKDIIVAGPSTERWLARHTAETGLAQILAVVGKSVFGLKEASINFIVDLDPRPQHQSEFLKPLNVELLSKASSAYGLAQINSQKSVQEVYLGRWLFELGVSSTACAVWGEANPWHLDKEFAHQFSVLAESFDTLGRPFPRLTARRAYLSREFLLARLQQFHERHRETRIQTAAHRINAVAMSDPNWENNPDYFRVELLSSLGLLVTASTLIGWLVWHLLAEPATLDKVLSEVRSPETLHESLDDKNIGKICPHLVAAWHETLRLHMTGVPRLARRDFRMNTHGQNALLMTTGDIVMLPMYAFNRDVNTWGEDVDRFIPERFFDTHGKLSNSMLRKVKGFGVAGNLCPGRTFGTNTAMAIVVAVLRRYDVASVDGGLFQKPVAMKGLHIGFQRYEGDVKVRLTEAVTHRIKIHSIS